MRLLERERRQQPALENEVLETRFWKPSLGKQNVPPFGAARGRHSMLAAERVNTPQSLLRRLVNPLVEHDLFGKPVSTFPDHAPTAFLHCKIK
jgi:hypothetical protein